MKKNILKIISLFVIGIFGGIFADQILCPYLIEKSIFYKNELTRPVFLTETKEIIVQENTALKEAVEKAEKSVVGIRTKTKTGKILEGSGLIVTSDGLVVTLAEMVSQASSYTFFVGDKSFSPQLLKIDSKQNLALLKIEENSLATCGFADMEKLKLGERVFLVGVVFENGNLQNLVNEGIVKIFDSNFIETNIVEKSSLSGSPLFNIEGNVLGLNTISKNGEVITISISKIREFIGL